MEAQEKEMLAKEQQRLEALRQEIDLAVSFPGPNGAPASGEKLADYDRECKEILFKVRMLTHGDHVDREGFTEDQKRRLREHFDRAQAIYHAEWGLDRRPLPILLEILAKVRAIWETMGLNIEAERVIQGDILSAQMA